MWESDNTCRTCAAIPGKIIEVSESAHSALADVGGVTRQVDLMLIQDENPAPGEWVLIHFGFALSRVSEDDAIGHLHALEMLCQRDEQSKLERGAA
jgi:hydrogenase expression/formation protein HypC